MPANQRVDVIGIVLDVGLPIKIKTKDGNERDKASVTLGDESKVSIEVSIWGAAAISGVKF